MNSAGLTESDEFVLSPSENGYQVAHVFDEKGDRSRLAIKTAIAARRPLLVRGEPGVGKTQLALAAAVGLKRPLVSYVVDGHSEARDLLWRVDSVCRLAEAQLCHASGRTSDEARERLQTRNFVEPGPLWWGFDWKGAKEQSERFGGDGSSRLQIDRVDDSDPLKNGVVVLIDEIDKADADVPNGLLEALGSRGFHPAGCERVVQKGAAPLVIITTNEERILPDAFVRRCLVLRLSLPESRDELRDTLVRRGRAHFDQRIVSDDTLRLAADLLIADRADTPPPRPGLAEYIDLLRAFSELCREQGKDAAKEFMERLGEFTFKKYRSGE